jgi:hypothetical protein
MSKIDIEPLDEEAEEIVEKKSVKKPIKNDIEVERLRHDNFLKELEEIKNLIASQAKINIIERGETNQIKIKNQQENQKISQPFSFPQSKNNISFKENEEPQKMNPFIKFAIYLSLFVLSSVIAFSIIHFFFEADWASKIGFTIGAGFFVVIIIKLIEFLVNKFIGNKGKYPVQFSQNNDYSEYNDIKRCPICNENIAKSKVFQEGNQYKQILKCLNPSCEFRKELVFGV